MAVNRRRGEVAATIAGRTCRLCLTLGGLAELEDAFAAGDLASLAERFATGRLATGDLLAVLAIGLKGGGEAAWSEAELRALPADALPDVVAAVAALLRATFADGEGAPPNPF